MSGQPRVLAFGGASLDPSSIDGPLHQHLLDLTGRERPRICFVPTAGGDSPDYIKNFYAFFARRAEASHLALVSRQVDDIEAFLLEQDVIYVGGGNTANMLATWRVHGVDVALRRAWESGVILAGPSAGAMCWFESGLTDSFGAALTPLKDGLRFLKGSFCPHYDAESLRRPRYREVVGSGALPDGYAADDSVGLLFTNRELTEAIAVMPETRAFHVEKRRGGEAEEIPIRPRLVRG